jgi:hypothetical protein
LEVVKMKKCKFYTLLHVKGKGATAVLKEGYTDGVYNYYTYGEKPRDRWCAILPSCGLAVCHADTRKACVALAYSARIQKQINDIAPDEMVKNNQVFKVCVMNAEMEA